MLVLPVSPSDNLEARRKLVERLYNCPANACTIARRTPVQLPGESPQNCPAKARRIARRKPAELPGESLQNCPAKACRIARRKPAEAQRDQQ
jgi:hypothetical protein